MKPIKLSVCIAALAQRQGVLRSLIQKITTQDRFDECELVLIIDSGQMQTGAKRNRIADAAHGDYVVCIDDDDDIADDYIPRILEAIEAEYAVSVRSHSPDHCCGDPGRVDAILINGVCTSDGPTVFFDYRIGGLEGEWTGEGSRTVWRSPGHLCPIRAELARQVRFPQPTRGEDLAWSAELRPLIKTARRAVSAAGPHMYIYKLDPVKSTPRTQHVGRSHQEIFTPQYISKSGPGSTVGYSQPYRSWLERFIAENNFRTIIDLGCGDMAVMGNVELCDATYIGFDVIEERVLQNRQQFVHRSDMMFFHQDIRDAPLNADLIICKDVLQHWSTREVLEWTTQLQRSRDQFRYALITNCNYGLTINMDISTGGWRALDLTVAPFELGERAFSWGDEIGGYKDVVLIKGARPT